MKKDWHRPSLVKLSINKTKAARQKDTVGIESATAGAKFNLTVQS